MSEPTTRPPRALPSDYRPIQPLLTDAPVGMERVKGASYARP